MRASRCTIPHGMVLHQEFKESFKMRHSSWDDSYTGSSKRASRCVIPHEIVVTPVAQRYSRCTIPHGMIFTPGAQRELQDASFLMRLFLHRELKESFKMCHSS